MLFKFTHKGGFVCVGTERCMDEDKCVIKVEDDGVGIPKSQLDVILNVFRRLTINLMIPLYTGTGIGLSLSKEYINMHHGRIWAENGKDGKGSLSSWKSPVGKGHFSAAETVTYVDDNTAATKQERTPVSPQETEEQHDETLPVLILVGRQCRFMLPCSDCS